MSRVSTSRRGVADAHVVPTGQVARGSAARIRCRPASIVVSIRPAWPGRRPAPRRRNEAPASGIADSGRATIGSSICRRSDALPPCCSIHDCRAALARPADCLPTALDPRGWPDAAESPPASAPRRESRGPAAYRSRSGSRRPRPGCCRRMARRSDRPPVAHAWSSALPATAAAPI